MMYAVNFGRVILSSTSTQTWTIISPSTADASFVLLLFQLSRAKKYSASLLSPNQEMKALLSLSSAVEKLVLRLFS